MLLTKQMLLVAILVSAASCLAVQPQHHVSPQGQGALELHKIDTLWVGDGLKLSISEGSRSLLRAKDRHHLVRHAGASGTLRLSGTAAKQMPVYLALKHLPKNIHLTGNSTVSLSGAKHRITPLYVKVTGNGVLNLSGWLNIAHIDNTGDATITAHWLKGPQVEIHSRAGLIRVAGESHLLVAELGHQARLDATGLNAQHIWVYTAGQAMAKLNPLKTLNATAVDQSQIAYVKQLPAQQIQSDAADQSNIIFLNRHIPSTYPKQVVQQKPHLVLGH